MQGQSPPDEDRDNSTSVVATEQQQQQGEAMQQPDSEEEEEEEEEEGEGFESNDDEPAFESDIEGGDEGEAPGNLSKTKVGRSPSLPDQIQLLLPGPPPLLRDPNCSESEDDDNSVASSLDQEQDERDEKGEQSYEEEEEEIELVRAESPIPLQRPANIALTRRGSSFSTSSEQGELPQRPDKSLRIDNSDPPWIAMVEVMGGW